MSANVVTFTDIRAAHFRKRMQDAPAAMAQPIMADMCDAALVVQDIFNLSKFCYQASQLAVNVVSIIGADEDELVITDEDLAERIGCSARTVLRWRAAYIADATVRNYSPILITEANYDPKLQRTPPATYSIKELVPIVEMAVAEARGNPLYKSDRREALRLAAEAAYNDIPEAAPIRRKRKPGKRIATPLSYIEKGNKNLGSAKTVLSEMPEHRRRAFIDGNREQIEGQLQLLRQQAEMLQQLLSDENVNSDNVGVSHHNDNLSSGPEGKFVDQSRVSDKKEESLTADRSWRLTEVQDYESENTNPEAQEIWSTVMDRFNQPAVRRTEISIEVDPDPPIEPTIEYDPQALADEIAERAAILEFDGNLSRDEAESIAYPQDGPDIADDPL